MGTGADKMTFLIQIPQLIFGGAEKVLVSFTKCLVEHGHEVEVLETYERGLLRDQFDPRVRFSAICSKAYTAKYYASLVDIRAEVKLWEKLKKCAKLGFSKLVGYRKFAEHLTAKQYRNRRFDVAINYLEIESPAFLLNNIHASLYLQWIHTDVKNMDPPDALDKYLSLYRKMDAIFCVADSARTSFTSMYPVLCSKTYTLYNFFDAEAILKKASVPFAFSSERPILLSVGRMTPPKKYLRFLDVLAKLKSEGYAFSWHVLGTGMELEAIKQRIAELHLSECVFLDGLTDNPYRYMAACDLFVLPSGWEGFPTVTIEAKLLGKPVLATDVSGIREQLEDEVTGLIAENSEEGIYNGLKTLLDRPELCHTLSKNAGINKLIDNELKYQTFIDVISACQKEPSEPYEQP